MIARKKLVRNLKGGNEARGQVRRRLKFRPIFCPFFSLTSFPSGYPFSLSCTLDPLPLFYPSTHARAYTYFHQFLPSSPPRASITPHYSPPHFYPLASVLGKPGIIRLVSSLFSNMYTHVCTPLTPSLPPPSFIYLVPPSQPPSFLPRLTGRVLFLFSRAFPSSSIESRERLAAGFIDSATYVSFPSVISVSPKLYFAYRTHPAFYFFYEIRKPRAHEFPHQIVTICTGLT